MKTIAGERAFFTPKGFLPGGEYEKSRGIGSGGQNRMGDYTLLKEKPAKDSGFDSGDRVFL